jgi:hypothetical protein
MHHASRRRDLLFYTSDGAAALRASINSACATADALQEDRLLNTDVDALVSYFVERHQLVVPELVRDDMEATQHERQVEVYDQWNDRPVTVIGEAYDFELPFIGDSIFFTLKPTTFNMNPPIAKVVGQKLEFTISGRSLNPGAVKEEVERLVRSIEQYLSWHRGMMHDFSIQLEREVRERIEGRRARLLKQKGSATELAGLGIKIKEKLADARTYVPSAVKQKVQPQLPPMRPSRPPEPTLDQAVYENILGIIRGAGRSIEQSSSRTRALDEESLRDMFLVPLNAHFGNATGEAFNVTGKTDILIRHETGNIFVAEFKIWGGDKHFLATIDQLLSYLSWRDTKTAIVVFNRNVGFSAVVAKIRELAMTHKCYSTGPTRLDETSDRYEFTLPDDPDRKVTVAMLAFDLGVK